MEESETSQEEIIGNIRAAYRALARGNVEVLLDLCSDGATLTWGPFKFEGKTCIEKWARELLQAFTSIGFVEKSIAVKGSEVKHQYFMSTVNQDLSKGVIEAMASYKLEGRKIKDLKIDLLDGYVIRKASEAEGHNIKPV